jgi:hypothetical protein
MTAVRYTGPANFQEFGKADFAKADVDQGKLVFPQGESVEVSQEVHDALTAKDGIFGDFSFESANEDEAVSPAQAKVSKKQSSDKTVPSNEGAALQEDTGAAATPATAGTTTAGTSGTAGTTTTPST